MANKYIQKVGFNAFSYSDLADEIGIKKASIHYHFPSKMDLGIAYCHLKLNQLLVLEKTINLQNSLESKLTQYCRAFLPCAKKHEMCGIYSMFTEMDSFSKELQEAVKQLVESELNILRKIFKGQSDFDINIERPKELALIVNSTIKGALLINRISKHDLYEQSMNALIQLILSNYK